MHCGAQQQAHLQFASEHLKDAEKAQEKVLMKPKQNQHVHDPNNPHSQLLSNVLSHV